ncbi:MAG TPA: DeoR/GlpR family DNA-binding transcription regulator [Jatrophihabitans sp.]|nr:DeoR/GlpR family DNA-binding transcription regulator [Jatrophihabitans sp.]
MAAILEHIAEAGSVDVARISADLSVSPATLRRDLKALQDQGLLKRTHGGAVASGVGFELPLRHREARHQPEKRAIGRLAASLVPEGAVVGMTGGTTATEVARVLPNDAGITVVTNALNIAAELVLRPSLRVVVVGGAARHASYELIGPAAEMVIARYHLDVSFIGIDGLTVEEGCSTYDEMEAHTDHAFISRAKRTIVIGDSTKLGKRTFARICRTDEMDDLVTDSAADPEFLARLREAGVNVLIAAE